MRDDERDINVSRDIPNPTFTERRTMTGWERRLRRFPDRMLNTEINSLPAAAQQFLREHWNYGEMAKHGEGFILVGDTGVGKTRAACMVALRMAAETWGMPEYLSCVGFRSKAFSDWGAADAIITQAGKAAILVLDDMGKGTPSSVVDDILFAILDGRGNRMKPTIITTQYLPAEMKRRFKEPETADAGLRRILEFNEPITLTK